MRSVEGGRDGIRIMNEVTARFADAACPEGVTQSAIEMVQNRLTKSGVSLADGIPARDGLRNDPYANHGGYQYAPEVGEAIRIRYPLASLGT